MTDTSRTGDASPRGVPALVTYLAFAYALVVFGGLFWIIVARVPVDVAILALLGSVVTSAIAGPAAVYGYRLAASNSANQANKTNSAVIAQAAGATPPVLPAPAEPAVESKDGTQ